MNRRSFNFETLNNKISVILLHKNSITGITRPIPDGCKVSDNMPFLKQKGRGNSEYSHSGVNSLSPAS